MRQPPHLTISPQLQQFLIHFTISFIFGLLWFWILYDRLPLYTSHVDWIYAAGADVLQHQLGWEWFRNEPWRFPLGSIQAYGYPMGTSVAFMDSIPLFAIPFKLLSPWLEPEFQYFGLWELSAVMGQMMVGMLILHEFTRSYSLKILGASLLVLSPPMILRAFYHSSLSAHWILLAAIWFILLEYRGKVWRGAWVALFAVALLIHIYFIPMLIPLWMIGMYLHYKKENRRWTVIFEILAVVVVLLLIGYSTGLFNLSINSLSVSGFGLYSWNLNGFFNPFHFSSTYIKEMVTGTKEQYEGFSYLGLGTLMILPAALYLFIRKPWIRSQWTLLLPFITASIVYTLFALSHKAFLFAFPVWDIPIPDSVLEFFNLFRASGRFIWPVFYFLVLIVLITIIRNVRYAAPILILVLLLQLSDLQPLLGLKKISEVKLYDSHLDGEFWESAARTNKHIVVIPTKKLSRSLEPVALYAAHHQFTLNLGYFARSDTRAFEIYAEQVWRDINANQADPQTIYLITKPEWVEIAKADLADELLICEIDGFNILLSADNELTKTDFNFSPYCAAPAH